MSDEIPVAKVKIDSHTRYCLTAISILLTLLVAGMCLQAVPAVPAARAADDVLPNAAAQRAELIRLQQQTNDKLDRLIALFADGQAKVQMASGADGAAGADHAKPKAE